MDDANDTFTPLTKKKTRVLPLTSCRLPGGHVQGICPRFNKKWNLLRDLFQANATRKIIVTA